MLNVKEMLAYLKGFSPRVVALQDDTHLIRKVMCIEEHTSFEKDVVYIGYEDQITYRAQFIQGMTLFLIRRGQGAEKEVYKDNTIIIFSEEVEESQLYERCLNYMKIQEQLLGDSHRLTSAFLREEPLQSLLNLAAEIIGNPIMIIDTSYRIIGSSEIYSCEDEQWNESIEKGYWSYEFISQFNQLSKIRHEAIETLPFVAGCLMSPMRRCISKLYAEKRKVGYLLSIESNQQFDERMVQEIEMAGKILSKALAFLVLQKEISVGKMENILSDILDNRIKDLEDLKKILQSTKLGTDSQYYMILIDIENYAVKDAKEDSLNSKLIELFPKSILSYYEKNIILLIDSRKEKQEIMDFFEREEPVFKDKGLQIIISNQFGNMQDIRMKYEQLHRANNILKKIKKDRGVCFYDDIQISDLLCSTVTEDNYESFLSDSGKRLYDYDQEHGTEYFKTVFTYVQCGKHLQETADQLFIHKNTVSYRISKVKELFNIDLSDTQLCMQLYLSYLLLELAKHGLLTKGDE